MQAVQSAPTFWYLYQAKQCRIPEDSNQTCRMYQVWTHVYTDRCNIECWVYDWNPELALDHGMSFIRQVSEMHTRVNSVNI